MHITPVQSLRSQYTEEEGYLIRKPKSFTLRDPGDGSEPYLSIQVEDERCVAAANPKNKQVSITTDC